MKEQSKQNMDKQEQDEKLLDMERGMGLNVDENMAGSLMLDEELTDNTMEEDLAKKEQELQSATDKYLRLNADFDNYRKRMAKERLDLIQNAGAEVMKNLLDVLDDSERSLSTMDKTEDLAQLKEGVKLVFQKLKQVLQSQGLSVMEALNQDFNPDVHEAITEIEAGPTKQGKVVDIIAPGYYLNDKLIRHAKVVVGK